jgi:hypothetical protein
MDQWSVLGIFMLGAAGGALLTQIAYAGRISKLKHLMDSLAARSSSAPDRPDSKEECKSARGPLPREADTKRRSNPTPC